MAILTGRYSNKRINDDEHYPVGISLGKPRFPTGYQIREQCYALAPKSPMLKMEYDPYRVAYFQKLDDIGVDKIISIVQRLEASAAEEGKDLVLLCFEDIRKPGQWCHRTLFAEWWLVHTGEAIEELEENEPPKVKGAPVVEAPAERMDQTSLF